MTKGTLARDVFENKPPVVWSCLWYWEESTPLVVVWQLSWASRESGENFWIIIIIIIIIIIFTENPMRYTLH